MQLVLLQKQVSFNFEFLNGWVPHTVRSRRYLLIFFTQGIVSLLVEDELKIKMDALTG